MRSRPYTAPPFYPHLSVRFGEGAGAARRVRAYRQVRDYTCGFASALTVLHAFRRYVQPEELYDRLGTDRTGTRQKAIVRELRAEGLSAIVRYDLEFEDIARHIGLSVNTVHGYIKLIFKHFNVHSQSELIARFSQGDGHDH